MSRATAFGRAVRKARIKRKLSQEAFAELCGLHRNAVGLLEKRRAGSKSRYHRSDSRGPSDPAIEVS